MSMYITDGRYISADTLTSAGDAYELIQSAQTHSHTHLPHQLLLSKVVEQLNGERHAQI